MIYLIKSRWEIKMSKFSYLILYQMLNIDYILCREHDLSHQIEMGNKKKISKISYRGLYQTLHIDSIIYIYYYL